MNGDFGTSMVLGTLLARGSVKNPDDVARIGLTAGIASFPMGLVIAKALTDDAVARQDRETGAATVGTSAGPPPPPTPVPPSPPPPPPPVDLSGQTESTLRVLKEHTQTLGAVSESLKDVATKLTEAAYSFAESSAAVANATKVLAGSKKAG